MVREGIYRILSEQETSLDLENKYLSFALLSKREIIEMRMQNRHKVYRRKTCRWDGKILSDCEAKNRPEKDFCNGTCNRKFLLFNTKILYGKGLPTTFDVSKIQVFKNYCLVQMIFRTPMLPMAEHLKKLIRAESISLQVVSKRKQYLGNVVK